MGVSFEQLGHGDALDEGVQVQAQQGQTDKDDGRDEAAQPLGQSAREAQDPYAAVGHVAVVEWVTAELQPVSRVCRSGCVV